MGGGGGGGRALLPTCKKIKNDKTLTTNIYHIIHTLYIIPSARRNKYIAGRALGLFLFDDYIDYVHVHVYGVWNLKYEFLERP